MTLKNSTIFWLCAVLAIMTLTGCRASGNRRAPVEDRGGASSYRAPVEDRGASSRMVTADASGGSTSIPREPESSKRNYVIQKGDTLYSIAFENGLDYREVADLNSIKNPAAIQIGQQIQLPNSDSGVGAPASTPMLATKTQPKVVKLPYSEQAVAQIEGGPPQEPSQVAVITVAPVAPKAVAASQEKDTATDDAVQWAMPAKGKLISGYSESANRKGIDIAGNKGQPVIASSAGKVVYSGSGLRGYGKLVIIKHNKTYLSAYAHNDKILVKEGQSVKKGQKIAEMGNSDADQVKLHFEIRKFGKPVDPAKYLNLSKL